MTARSSFGHEHPWHHMLHAHFTLGALTLGVDAGFSAPWSILFGPSGSGKSSILRALSGLLRSVPSTVIRHVEGLSVNLTSLPPSGRAMAYAPQHAAIFPHLTVRQNIAFSATIRHQPTTLAGEAIALFDLAPLADRSPERLSGGERQRVNLARAFAVPEAKLMVLDEPFTGLDLKLRDQLIPRMQQFLTARNLPCISVTHDVDEALLLNAEVLRIDAGRVLAQGQARTVLAEERTRLLDSLR